MRGGKAFAKVLPMDGSKEVPFYCGTSNIVVPARQADYPPAFAGASRLTYYASLFTSLEVNASFYKLPRTDTVRKWAESVPDRFRFTFKVPKWITHAKGLQFDAADVAAFANVVSAAGEKKGCLLVQFPPSVKRELEEELGALLESLVEEAPGWKIAVEFRDRSWHSSAVYRLLQRYGATLVEQDLPACATPRVDVSADFSYLRFHGPEGGYRGSYEDSVLEAYAVRIADALREGREMFVYFNNTMGDAFRNGQTLMELTRRRLGEG